MKGLAAVLGVGASTPYGLDARQTTMFMRPRKLAPRPTAFLKSNRHRIGTIRSERLSDELVGLDRMLALAAPALKEARWDAQIEPGQALRVFMALPEPSRPFPEKEQQTLSSPAFLSELARASGTPIDVQASATVRLGNAGFATALERALAHASEGPVAVGGVDTYHHPDVLAWLNDGMRLTGGGVEHGFVPSEAASFIVLGPADSPESRPDRPVLARVLAARSGLELPKTKEEPRTADLMVDLLRLAAAKLSRRPVAWAIVNLNGEYHRDKEWTFTRLRNPDLLEADHTLEDQLCQAVGDIGAATGALYATYVATAFRAGFAPADEALISLMSDGDERGVFALASGAS